MNKYMTPNTPVYPMQHFPDGSVNAGGLTTRDYIAIQMGHALLINEHSKAAISELAKEDNIKSVEFFARAAYQFADALIAESNKKSQ
jgi:hypothetical protein